MGVIEGGQTGRQARMAGLREAGRALVRATASRGCAAPPPTAPAFVRRLKGGRERLALQVTWEALGLGLLDRLAEREQREWCCATVLSVRVVVPSRQRHEVSHEQTRQHSANRTEV